jgi:arylsulfatase
VAKPFGPATWQLFNVTEDPGETRDLSKEKPAMLKELTDAWDQYANDVGVILSE